MLIGVKKCFFALPFVFVSVLAAKVDRLEVDGIYRSPNCSVNVTCYVRTLSTSTNIKWSLHGGPSYITEIDRVPGFIVRPVQTGPFGFKQTISIQKCYNKLELKCKANGSKKSVKLYLGTGISLNIPLRTIIGIVFGVLFVAVAIGAFFIIRKRRAAAKARTTEFVSLNPPTDGYPSQTTAAYPQGPGFAYPQQNTAYPPPAGAAYPPPAPASGYQQYPTTAYPPQSAPYFQYPAPTGVQQPPSQDPPPYYATEQPPAPGFK